MSAAGQPERVSPDTEGEKPVRERLQKASIDASATMYEDSGDSATATKKDDKPTGSEATGTTGTAETTGPATRGRPQRKRSHDEATADDTQKASESKHGRKRSRDGTLDDDEVGDSSKRQSLDIARPHVEAADKTATNGERKSNELKRSGYSTPPSEEVKDVDPESFVSPKTKRSRVGDKKAAEAQEAVKDDAEVSKTDAAAKDAGVDKKATTTNGTEKTSNTKESTPLSKEESSAKPSVEKAPASDTVTSPSAFAASGFGAFASSSTSGFGSVATGSKLSSFASPEPETKGTAATKPSTSTFGGALGAKSAFGGTASGSGFGGGSSSGFGGGSNSGFGGSSGFGGGSAFGGSAFGGSAGSKLSSFASPAGATFGGPKKATRAFGAPAGEDEEEGSGDEGEGEDENKIKSPKEDTEEKRDERFFQQDLETGEENETTEYTCRAKLYNFVSSNPSDASSKKEWKERGLGTLRLNVQNSPNADVEAGAAAAASKSDTHDSNDEGKVRARLVMRADGSHRVVLNTPIKKELRFGSVTGGAPQGGFVYFMGSVDGSAKLELLQLKMRQQFAVELYEHITGLQEAM